MHRLLKILTFWLLSLAAICSCSKEMIMLDEEGIIMITGTVSEADSATPLEGAQVCLEAFYTTRMSDAPGNRQTVYTDSDGTYSIKIGGIRTNINCTITVSHEEYEDQSTTIMVNWSETSLDEEKNTFFVNDCNFHLKKKR